MNTNQGVVEPGATKKNDPAGVDNITEGMLSQQFLERHNARHGLVEQEEPVAESEPDASEEEPEVVEEAEIDETEPEAVAESEPAEEEVEEDNSVLSQLEGMSEDELSQLGDLLKTKVPRRFGQLTAQKKAAEEKLARLEAELSQKRDDPLAVETPIENNPFSDVDTVDDLRKQAETMAGIEEWADRLLDENEDLGMSDYVIDSAGNDVKGDDGEPLTKRKVKEYLRNAKQARTKFLPARLGELQSVAQREHMDAALTAKAKEDFGWFEDKDADVHHQYNNLLNSPEVKMVSERVPEIMPQMRYMLAHFADSFYKQQNPPKKTTAKKSAPLTPPSNPQGGVGTAPQGRQKGVAKQLGELESRFQESHDQGSFIALRTAQRQLKQR